MAGASSAASDGSSEPVARPAFSETFVEMVVVPIRFVGFWVAVALPFLYVPLLLHGLSNGGSLLVFVGLLTANVFALVIGHDYGR